MKEWETGERGRGETEADGGGQKMEGSNVAAKKPEKV